MGFWVLSHHYSHHYSTQTLRFGLSYIDALALNWSLFHDLFFFFGLWPFQGLYFYEFEEPKRRRKSGGTWSKNLKIWRVAGCPTGHRKRGLRVQSPNLPFFSSNPSEICTQYVKSIWESIFAKSIIYFFHDYPIFFSKKKHLFPTLLKRIEVQEFS